MARFIKKNSAAFIGLLFIAIIGIFFIFLFFNHHRVSAASTQDVFGWAWSENIGWISFNSRNCDADNNGQSDGSPGCPPAGTAMTAYNVTVDMATGNFSGYAWSEQIGWIKFAPTTIPPGEASAKPVRLDIDGTGCGSINYVCGWARVCSAVADKITCEGVLDPSAGGWDGWIHFRNGTPPPYGVTWNGVTGEFSGWAWSDKVLGWMSTNCNNEAGACSGSNYKIHMAPIPPPVSGICSATHYGCIAGTSANNNETPVLWSWDCTGSGGGSTASCTEMKPPPPPPIIKEVPPFQSP